MATSKCLPKLKGMGWAWSSWGLSARARRAHCHHTGLRDGPPAKLAGELLYALLARVLAQHDEAAAIGRIAAREGRFSPHRHLPWTRCPPKLLHAIREEGGAVAPRSVIATTGKEGMRTFHPDVVGIKVVGLSSLDTVPLEALEELLCEREVAVVRVEDVNIRRPEPRALPHLPCQARD